MATWELYCLPVCYECRLVETNLGLLVHAYLLHLKYTTGICVTGKSAYQEYALSLGVVACETILGSKIEGPRLTFYF